MAGLVESFGAAFEQRVASARATWRDVDVDPETFAAHLAARLEGPGASLDQLHIEDLYLACGCVAGSPQALAAFDRAHGAGILLVMAATGIERSAYAAMAARVRERLLVGAPDASPKIAAYTGKGSLGSWVRIFALREAQRLVAQDAPP